LNKIKTYIKLFYWSFFVLHFLFTWNIHTDTEANNQLVEHQQWCTLHNSGWMYIKGKRKHHLLLSFFIEPTNQCNMSWTNYDISVPYYSVQYLACRIWENSFVIVYLILNLKTLYVWIVHCSSYITSRQNSVMADTINLTKVMKMHVKIKLNLLAIQMFCSCQQTGIQKEANERVLTYLL